LTIHFSIDIHNSNIEKYKVRSMKTIIKRDLFDFEIGYLTKSPCLNCKHKSELPKCHTSCMVLDKIQTMLARGISCQSSSYES